MFNNSEIYIFEIQNLFKYYNSGKLLSIGYWNMK